jgi:hypothetical protein
MKTGKFITLGYYGNVKIGYGTVDCKNLKTIYIKLNSWIQPESKNNDEFNYLLSKAKRKIKLRIYNLKTNLFKKESIVDLDVRTKGIKPGKKSFLNLEITLFTQRPFDVRSIEPQFLIKNLGENIVDLDLSNKILFNFHKNKK